MSKSKGNIIEPLAIAEKYGVDALRMALVVSVLPGVDSSMSEDKIRGYRNFANKIWNATRFCLLHSDNAKVDHQSLMLNESASIADKWIVSRLNKTALEVNKAIDKYEFHTAVSLLYHFFWDDFCDWYI